MRAQAARNAASAALASSGLSWATARAISTARSFTGMVAPKAVRAAERTLASGSSASFSRTAVTVSMCRRPARSINTSRLSPEADCSRAANRSSISLAGRSAKTSTAASETSALASSAASRSTGPQEASPSLFSPRIEAIRTSPAPLLAACSRASRALGSARSARASSKRACRAGAAWRQLGQQGVGHFRIRKSRGSTSGPGRTASCRPTSRDRPAEGARPNRGR